MKIKISDQNNPRTCFLDTDVSNVTITQAYIGPTFVTDDGEELVVIMRDSGFEIIYTDRDDVEQLWSLNDGFVRRLGIRGKK